MKKLLIALCVLLLAATVAGQRPVSGVIVCPSAQCHITPIFGEQIEIVKCGFKRPCASSGTSQSAMGALDPFRWSKAHRATILRLFSQTTPEFQEKNKAKFVELTALPVRFDFVPYQDFRREIEAELGVGSVLRGAYNVRTEQWEKWPFN